jgi:hypothetical protein
LLWAERKEASTGKGKGVKARSRMGGRDRGLFSALAQYRQ